jgi:general secretion pathway protein L
MSLLRLNLANIADPTALQGEAELLACPFDAALAGIDPVLLRATLPALPAAGTLEIVLPAHAVRITRIKLPKVRASALRRVLPNLIEDSVVGDPAESHAAPIGEADADGLREVAIVSRDWMNLARRIIVLRRPRHAMVISEVALLPHLPFLVVHEHDGYLRHAGGVLPFQRNSTTDIPLALRLARKLLGSGAASGADGSAAPVVPASGIDEATAASWSQALNLALKPTPWHWAKAMPAPAAASLLQFEYAGQAGDQGASARAWRWPIGLAAASAVVAIAGLNAHWWQLSAERDALRARIRTDFHAAFPNVPLNTDPLLLARRELARVNGSQTDDAYFALSTALAGAVDAVPGKPAIRGMEYRGGVLRARMVAGANVQQVADKARAAGVEANPETPGPDGAPVLVLRQRVGQ